MNMKIKRIITLIAAVAMISAFSGIRNFSADAAAARPDQYNKIAVGTSHALIIDNEGNVWSMGGNDHRQLGDGTTETRWVPNMIYHNSQSGKAISVAAGGKQSMLLTEDGTVLLWGYGESEMRPQLDNKAVAISAGQEFCMAILQNGTARVWSDKIPVRTVKDESDAILSVSEISVGSNEMILLRESGSGTVYQLDTDNYSTAVPVRKVSAITPTPSSSPTIEPTPTEPVEPTPTESVEPTLTSAPVDGFSLKGNKAFETDEGEVLSGAVSISAGYNFGMALMPSGEVFTWGDSRNGVLGRGSLPSSASSYYPLAEKIEGFPQGTKIKSISAGNEHAIVISEAEVFYGWGNSYQYRLDSRKSGIIPNPVSLDLDLPDVSLIECGNEFNLAVNTDGSVYIWGNNNKAPAQPVVLVQNLMRVTDPLLLTEDIGDEQITVKWDPTQYYTGLIAGFVVTYTMPDGTENRTLLLPVTMSQIILKGLQPETNYRIVLQIHGKSGFMSQTEAVSIMTLKDDGITPTPEPTTTPTLEPTAETSSEIISESSATSEPSGTDERDPSKLLEILLIGLIAIVIIGAIIAMIYVWRRIDRNDGSGGGVKPVRIDRDDVYDDLRDYGSPEDQDYIMLEEPDPDVPPVSSSVVSWQDVGDEDTAVHDVITQEDESAEADDDDDFIIRRPGEPKK
ncbi:MAG: fibronectin type III domain-containing protein [Eubacteriales bacterium]|nr:fibronectin type III domain-containing protein [Eubacteriales bacterium]